MFLPFIRPFHGSIALVCTILIPFFGVSATFTVSNDLDAGAGSFRQAIIDANATAGADNITFTTGASSVTLASNLDPITEEVVIDGSGATGGRFEIRCNYVANGLIVDAFDVSLSFLVINESSANGVFCNDGRLSVEECYIGVDKAGTSNSFNTNHGISLTGGSTYEIRDCVVSGNGSAANPGSHGIYISGVTGVDIMGNYIGLDATGSFAIGNNAAGVYTQANTGVADINIGSGSVADRNVISGNNTTNHNTEPALRISAQNVRIQGNYIGLAADGTTAVANTFDGIFCILATNVTIGGTGAGEGNIVSGNTRAGIWVNNFVGNTFHISGNYVGLDANGDGGVGNGTNGIIIENADVLTLTNNIIGGNGTVFPTNPFSKGWNGIRIEASVTNVNAITGNIVGFEADTTTAAANKEDGLHILSNAQSITIGGTSEALRNFFGNSEDGFGVRLQGTSNKSFFNNYVGLGVDGSASGNGAGGFLIYNSSSSNIIGGTGASEANTIAFNENGSASTSLATTGTFDNTGFGFGVGVANNSSGNLISRNLIYCNEGQGIDLNFADHFQVGVGDGNSSIAAPVISTRTTTSITGTSAANATIEVYSNEQETVSASCDCEGRWYLTTVTADGSGNWTANISGLGVNDASAVTATATDGSNNTSEFEACNAVLPLFDFDFEGGFNGHGAELIWSVPADLGLTGHAELWSSMDGTSYAFGTSLNASEVHAEQFETGIPFPFLEMYYEFRVFNEDGVLIYLGRTHVQKVFDCENVHQHWIRKEPMISLAEEGQVKLVDVTGKCRLKVQVSPNLPLTLSGFSGHFILMIKTNEVECVTPLHLLP